MYNFLCCFKRVGGLKKQPKQAEEQKAFYKETIEAYRRRILLFEELNKRLKESNGVYKMGCNFYKKQVKWAFNMVRKLLEERSQLREENAKLREENAKLRRN
jgi:hypothetical protein